MAKKITYTDKQQSQSLPGIPTNQKFTFQDANQLKNVINEHFERLALDWNADIVANDIIVVGQPLFYNDGTGKKLYVCNTSYNVGAGKTFTLANFDLISGGGGGTGIFEPVQDITALKALDTTTAADWPDKWAILVEDEGQFYRLDRDSAVTESLPEIVAPTTGTGRWIRDQDLQLEAKTDKDGGDSQLIHVPQDSDNSTGFFAGLLTLKTNTALLLKTALDRIVSVIKTKADKATGHTTGNLAELNADGNPVDSGISGDQIDIYNVAADVKTYLENDANWTGDTLVVTGFAENGDKGQRYTSFTTGYTYEVVEEPSTWARYPLNLRTVNILTMLAAEKTKLELSTNWTGTEWKTASNGGQDLSTDSTGKIHYDGTYFYWVIDNNLPMRLTRG